ncbi:uncharacterized protein LOC123271345 [Cotesia glomerata]|uniref:Uncharacterized protein n=1 Tax=Cotesia glomerata TaxID=32391 RepID=A0AAV7IQ70_COTGL|nr:uncharacterized protein LOC123271345 [Cotesia glomerata]KAH0557225.1 hypothetical protein KQX54_001962 [Cotesia glomerata]
MRLIIFLSILGLGQSIDLGAVFDIDDLIVFIKTAGSRLSEAADELNDLEIDGTKKYAEVIDTYLIQMPHNSEEGEKYQKLKDLVEKIDQAWNDLGTKDPGDDDKTQLAALATTRDELYDHYVGDETTQGLPMKIATAEEPNMCELTDPDQLRLKKIHQAVALSELRTFILNLKAGEDNQKAVAKAVMQSEEYILTSKLGFEETSNNFHACDPPEHIRGETFGEFLGLFQGVVVNDGHTNNKPKIGECGESCDELDDTRIEKCFKPLDGYGRTSHCHRKKCLGRLFECDHVQNTNVCELEPTSDRRFSWVWSEGQQKHYGKYDGDCEGNITDIKESKELQRSTCVTCLCICAEEDPTTKATRTVSLVPQFADIKKNMVVTGVRFQENNKVFHVQIEESKMGPLGEIVSGTSKWKKLDSFTYDPKTGSFQTRKRLRKQQLHENLDYKIFNRDSRTVNLDKVETSYGEVIVGVSLVYCQDYDAVQIQILSWPFDFKTGELKDPINLEDEDVVHDWITWKNTPRKPSFYDNDRSEIELRFLDDPALAPKNQIISDPNDKIKIGTTGYEVDMAQHTIPYITLQDVTYSDKKTALGGLEIYYARAEGFGGFLGFMIQGYDFSKNFRNKMNQEEIDKYQPDFDGQLPQQIPVKDM